MAEIMVVVPEKGVNHTGRVSYRFLLDSNAPTRVYSRAWGVLFREKKGDDYFEPFKAVTGSRQGTFYCYKSVRYKQLGFIDW